jgi:hypothetical protein
MLLISSFSMAAGQVSARPMKSSLTMGVTRFGAPRDMYEWMEAATRDLAPDACVRNFCAAIERMDRDAIVVETPLFPADALAFYTHHNLGSAATPPPELFARMDELRTRYYDPARGGAQGDYRAGMASKVQDVVDCLRRYPGSKRAVLCIPFSSGQGSHEVSHESTDEAKCLREIHFYIDGADARVHASGFMRAQAAAIFPKNIHFIGTLLNVVAESLGRLPGSYTHFVTTLVHGR